MKHEMCLDILTVTNTLLRQNFGLKKFKNKQLNKRSKNVYYV